MDEKDILGDYVVHTSEEYDLDLVPLFDVEKFKKAAEKFKEMAEKMQLSAELTSQVIKKLYAAMAEEIEDDEAKVMAVHAQFSQLSTKLPGIYEYSTSPCDCKTLQGRTFPLRSIIMHLNDQDMWSRDAIADWLESLDVDLEFKD